MTSDCNSPSPDGTCAHGPDAPIAALLTRNRAWAERKTSADPGFFKRLTAQQSPAYLWIGCSDSRVPATEIVDLDPGEVFVHRNVGNLAPVDDANYLSVLQYGVQVLKVRHVLVVGHYGCGGVLAALQPPLQGPVEGWLTPIRQLAFESRAELDALPDDQARHDRLCELNVLAQVRNVAATTLVRDAWAAGEDLTIHGWCYSIGSGLITDLNATVRGPLTR
ncbi:carbonic anhydrase [Caulobacter sp. S45]|jgi:carbonic anhydrase|uniref:carbonic anhydrase n=1 Tax=Caulobacter sp. S45 TaxID=1641861 RepID=UPI00131BCB50|nr:carbonic anhydrase [Caulobacter sp. S45]